MRGKATPHDLEEDMFLFCIIHAIVDREDPEGN